VAGKIPQLAAEEQPAQAAVGARPDVGEAGDRPRVDPGSRVGEQLGGRTGRAVDVRLEAASIETAEEVVQALWGSAELRTVVHVENRRGQSVPVHRGHRSGGVVDVCSVRPMRVALLGGVFGDPMGEYAASAPEAVLLRALRTLGQEVDSLPVSERLPPKLSADVFHAHHFGVGAYELALASLRPFVFTPHSGFLLVQGARSPSRLERALEEYVLRNADLVIALSQREADTLRERYGVRSSRLAVVPNGIELARYLPAERRNGGTIKLLAVGQMIPLKAHGVLLEAFAELRRRRRPVALTIVGHNQQLRPEYERRSRELGISDAVTFEALGADALAERYRQADIFVQPSLVECFPITVAEAMACGLPVVASDVGGVSCEVGAGGIVVPPGDVRALVAAIEPLVENEADRRRLGELAVERAHALFDSRAVAARHLELYRGLEPRRTPAVRRLFAAGLAEAYRNRAVVTGTLRRRAEAL
jgi:glycosyltransferase involved in cell wall biosynthesis